MVIEIIGRARIDIDVNTIIGDGDQVIILIVFVRFWYNDVLNRMFR